MTKEQELEYQKCIDSPYYFMTNYWMVNSEPYTTHLTEEQFNDFFKLRQWLGKPELERLELNLKVYKTK